MRSEETQMRIRRKESVYGIYVTGSMRKRHILCTLNPALRYRFALRNTTQYSL
jgi:hypothetical protein